MTEESFQKMVSYYGDRLANPEHFPATFRWQVRIFEYYRDDRNDRNDRNKENEQNVDKQ